MSHSLGISSTELKDLIAALDRAATSLSRFWPGGGNSTLKIYKKKDGTRVTEADYSSNDIITTELKRIFPQDGLISEELPIDRADFKKNRTWILDPLDGTHQFIAGSQNYCILLGALVQGVPEIGFILYPHRKELYYNQGSIITGLQSSLFRGSKIRAGKGYFRYLKPKISVDSMFMEDLDSVQAALRFARGELDCWVVKVETQGIWDIVPSLAIVRAAGAKLTDEKGNDIKFEDERISAKYLVAANSTIHADIIGQLE